MQFTTFKCELVNKLFQRTLSWVYEQLISRRLFTTVYLIKSLLCCEIEFIVSWEIIRLRTPLI